MLSTTPLDETPKLTAEEKTETLRQEIREHFNFLDEKLMQECQYARHLCLALSSLHFQANDYARCITLAEIILNGNGKPSILEERHKCTTR